MADTDSLVFVESVDANSLGSETPLEHLRAGATVATERGHRAEAFTRTVSGRIFTPPGFADRSFDMNLATGRAVAARWVEASEWGLSVGADYVARHWTVAASVDPETFARLENFAWAQTYASPAGDQWGVAAVPVGMFGNVSDVRLTPDGRTAVTLEWFRDPVAGVYGVFAYDLARGDMRLLVLLGSTMEEHGEISISPDGRYAIVGAPTPNLVDLHTGHTAGLGQSYRAATWYPKAGPSVLLAVTGDHEHPPWTLVLLDLATFTKEPVAELPRRVDAIQVARDGTVAARMNPVGEDGWFDELVVSTDDGHTFEPVLPLRGRSGWRRRGTRPRWVEPTAAAEEVVLDAGFEAFLREVPAPNTLNRNVIDWVLDSVQPQIKHRVLRLGEHPTGADILLGQLRVLTTLAVLFDPEMGAAVAEQVVPVAQAAAVTNEGRQDAAIIAAVAAGTRAPDYQVTFG